MGLKNTINIASTLLGFTYHNSTGYHRVRPPKSLRLLCGQFCRATTWMELYRLPGHLHTCPHMCPQSKEVSYLNTSFCQSVVFHVALAWHHCRRMRRCFRVKDSARKERLECRFISTKHPEIICRTTGTPTSICIVERVIVGSTSTCRPIIQSYHIVVFLVSPTQCARRGVISDQVQYDILCPLLSTCSGDSLKTIDKASNTVRQPACGFHAEDKPTLKLA